MTSERITRREILRRAGVLASAGALGNPLRTPTAQPTPSGASSSSTAEWLRSARLMIAEGYCPPFYPSLDYEPEKALAAARQLSCDSIRYPTFSYVAYFPTKTKMPRHPQLGSRDPFRETLDLFHNAGLKVVAYNPLNHPFMDVRSKNPMYRHWMRYDAEGRPMVTGHFGWTRFYEGCLNSPLRLQIRERVHEVISEYTPDVMYFDGPYEGMDQQSRYCHCKYCKAAYWQATGKDIPLQNGSTTLEEEIQYREWMGRDVVGRFLAEICAMVRQVREVPTLFNDTGLLSRWDWRARAFGPVDGFMFEAAKTPEQKLFNLRLGQSTGKVIWTYVGSHTEYNREHLKDPHVRGWFSYPVAGERLVLDAAVATAAEAGYCFWGLNRVFYLSPGEILGFKSLDGVKAVFDFARQHHTLLQSVQPTPQAGILTNTQAIRWSRDPYYPARAYSNYYYGAFQLLKSASYDAQAFLDYETTPQRLAKYKLVYVPNALCLSQEQGAALARYVQGGGALIATHMTSTADEYGRRHKNLALSDLFGVSLSHPEPVEIPDLYLRPQGSRNWIPQDPQVMRFTASQEADVLADTYSRGYRKTLGPAVVRRRYGKGQVIYIGSGLEAVYEETLNNVVRGYVQSLLDSILTPWRSYQVDFQPGLMTQFAASRDVLLLHLMADTGNIWNQPQVQELFLPLKDVRARLRVPPGRSAKSVTLLWSGKPCRWSLRNGWVELTVPQVNIYEVIRVDLS